MYVASLSSLAARAAAADSRRGEGSAWMRVSRCAASTGRYGRCGRSKNCLDAPATHQVARQTQIGTQRIQGPRDATKVWWEQGAGRQLEVAANECAGRPAEGIGYGRPCGTVGRSAGTAQNDGSDSRAGRSPAGCRRRMTSVSPCAETPETWGDFPEA